MSQDFDEKVLDAFLEQQLKLYPEKVAENREEAEEFLKDCLAVVCESIEEAMDYLDEAGMDISEMDEDELREAAEVFDIGDGRYLIADL